MVYENVYLVFLDASGHSAVVRQNPKDLATNAFDLLYKRVSDRLASIATRTRCDRAIVWSWLGDGGLIAIHDNSETVARDTAIQFTQSILKLDLPQLQAEFDFSGIIGELHIRVAAHKGTIKYTDEGQQGFIHSSDINWGAHLEKATPLDCLSISEDIYNSLTGTQRLEFTSVGQYEERNTYIWSSNKSNLSIRQTWYAIHGFQRVEMIQSYRERLSQQEKSDLIDLASTTVIDFGTTLNTCSDYLFTTARPTPYRDAVLRLLKRGGKFLCYMLAPDSIGANQLAELRAENTSEKLMLAMKRFEQYKKINMPLTENFHVYQYNLNPNFAAMVFDPDSDDARCLYSPYMNIKSKSNVMLGRADMPHYFVTKKNSLYSSIWSYICEYTQGVTQVL